jgi:murein L,D-transpeptidase YcbB/YkuD
MNNPEAYRNEIYEAFKTANEYDKKPEALQEQLDRKFEELMNGLLTNQDKQEYLANTIDGLQDILSTIEESINNMEEVVQSRSIEQLEQAGFDYEQIKNAGFTAEDFKKANVDYANAKSAGFDLETLRTAGYTEAEDELAQLQAVQNIEPPKTSNNSGNSNTSTKTTIAHPYGYINSYSGSIKKGASGRKVQAVQYALNKLIGAGLKVDGKFGNKTVAAVKKFQKKYGLTQDGSVGPNTKKKFKALGYSTGGIADYTGPAWLHGTPSKPELVLNAADTKNFLALKDVLSKAMTSTNSIESSYGGDMNFEVNINVDHLNNDYDVDKVADRVRKIIVKDAGYRNVTQVRNFR